MHTCIYGSIRIKPTKNFYCAPLLQTNLGNCVALGKPQLTVLDTDVRDAVKEGTGLDVQTGRKFYRIQLGSKVYHSLEYERVKKRNSLTIVYTKDGDERYGLILCFLSLPMGTFVVLSQLKSSSNLSIPLNCQFYAQG